MVFMNKRGISSIIAVALITLGVIIGVAVLWAFVSKNLNNAQKEVTDPDCLTINLQVVSCTAYGFCGYVEGLSGYEADIIVKRNPGRGNVTGLRFAFESNYGIKGSIDRDLNSINLDELSSVSFTEPYEGIPIPLSYPQNVRVVALLGPNKEVCPITSAPVNCPVVTNPLPLGYVPNYTYNPSGSVPFVYNRRGGNCCMNPVNYSACYDGGDPNYLFGPQGQLVNPMGQPSGLPPGNISVCCQYNPENGGPRSFV